MHLLLKDMLSLCGSRCFLNEIRLKFVKINKAKALMMSRNDNVVHVILSEASTASETKNPDVLNSHNSWIIKVCLLVPKVPFGNELMCETLFRT